MALSSDSQRQVACAACAKRQASAASYLKLAAHPRAALKNCALVPVVPVMMMMVIGVIGVVVTVMVAIVMMVMAVA